MNKNDELQKKVIETIFRKYQSDISKTLEMAKKEAMAYLEATKQFERPVSTGLGSHVKVFAEPELPEGFIPFDSGICPVPDDVLVSVRYDAENTINGIAAQTGTPAKYIKWHTSSMPIYCYKVDEVPTLSPDDIPDHYYYSIHCSFSNSKLNAFQMTIDSLQDKLSFVTDAKANLAYKTKEHAELAIKHGLIDKDYLKVLNNE